MVFETLRKFRYHLLVSGNGKFAGESVQNTKARSAALKLELATWMLLRVNSAWRTLIKAKTTVKAAMIKVEKAVRFSGLITRAQIS